MGELASHEVDAASTSADRPSSIAAPADGEQTGGIAQAAANFANSVADTVQTGLSSAYEALGSVMEAPNKRQPETINLPIPQGLKTIGMRLGSNNRMRLSWTPELIYDPEPVGNVQLKFTVDATEDPGRIKLTFQPDAVIWPPVSSATARFAQPMCCGLIKGPPGFMAVEVQFIKLEGYANMATGQIDLDLEADLVVVLTLLGKQFRLPPLRVVAQQSTEKLVGQRFEAQGERLNMAEMKSGIAAIGAVRKTGHWWLDLFLKLPNEMFMTMTTFSSFDPSS